MSAPRETKKSDKEKLILSSKLSPPHPSYALDPTCFIDTDRIAQKGYIRKSKESKEWGTSIDIVNTSIGKIEKQFLTKGDITGLAFDSDSNSLINSTSKGVLLRRDISTGACTQIFSDSTCNNVEKVRKFSRHQFICLDHFTRIKLWDIEKGTSENLFNMEYKTQNNSCRDVVVKGNYIIGLFGGEKSDVYVYNLNTKAMITFSVEGDKRRIAASDDAIAVYGRSVDFFDYEGTHLSHIKENGSLLEWDWCRVCTLPSGEFYYFSVPERQHDELSATCSLVNPRLENPIVQVEQIDLRVQRIQFNPFSGHLVGECFIGTLVDEHHSQNQYCYFNLDIGYKERLEKELLSSPFIAVSGDKGPSSIVMQYLGLFSKSQHAQLSAPAETEESEENEENKLQPDKKKSSG